jgi:hypothetical protein
MNERSLSALYRRLTLGKSAPLALDAETLASAADGTLTGREDVAEALARSPREADVVRLLGALKADSEALAADVARTTSRETTHRRHARTERRVAAGRRHSGVTRWATALAACLVAVVGAFTLRHSTTQAPQHHPHVVAKADRISHFMMDPSDAAPSKPDELFRSDFSGGG